MTRSASFSVVITSTTTSSLCWVCFRTLFLRPAHHVNMEGIIGHNKGHWRCCFANPWLTLERGIDITGIKHLKATR